MVSLPTFVKNGEKVPLEVLELLTSRKDVYNVLLQNYPSLLISSRSLSDSVQFHDQVSTPSAMFVHMPSSLSELKNEENKQKEKAKDKDKDKDKNKVLPSDEQTLQQQTDAGWRLWRLKKSNLDSSLRRSSTLEHSRRLPTAYLKDIRVHRHSLTYRGAMLNINRYRLRASSCPDIYRNSMTTIAKTKLVWYAGLWEFWDLVVDMLDFSHFADSRFLLFAISNFLLHTWYDVPYVYLTDNAIEMGFSETDASILISVIGISNMGGEILLGWAGDRTWVNASMVYAVCMAMCGAVTALIPVVVGNYYSLCAISGAFGLFVGANYSLTSIILVELITLERFTNAYGLLLLVQGVANLMGPPLAGWLYDITGSYDLSFYLAGFFIAISGALLLPMPLISLYRKYSNGSRKEETEEDFANMSRV
ncbi:Monocarboxylate transporter 5 [Anthophora retusa]